MSTATGRLAGSGNQRGCPATALPAPMPMSAVHQRHRHSAWLATSPTSSSGAAQSPPSFQISSLLSTTPRGVATHAAGSRTSTCSVAPATDETAGCPHSARTVGFRRCSSGHASQTSECPSSSPVSSSFPSSRGVRWPGPARSRVVRASAVASPPAPGPSTSSAGPPGLSGPGPGPAAVRPPSPSFTMANSHYFDGFCPEGATECSAIWGQLRWCSNWQQMRQLYDNLLAAEAAAAAATAAVAAQISASIFGGGGVASGSDSPSSSMDITAAAVSAAISAADVAAAGSGRRESESNSGESGSTASVSLARSAADATATAAGSGTSVGGALARGGSGGSPGAVPGLLTRDETYAFLLQLQDFYHMRLDAQELDELQAFRCRLVRDLSAYVRRLDAEQLEALCCASAVSGKCLTRERADAVQERLLKILTSTSAAANGHHHHHNNSNSIAAGHHISSSFAAGAAGTKGAGSAGGQQQQPPRGRGSGSSVGGFQVLTPALNIIFALYDHGYLPQVALLQAVFRQGVDHCCEVTRSQWHGLHGLSRRFRFLVDELWLEDLHAALRDPLSCTTDFGRLASILGCVSALTVNKAVEALDTRVLVVVEAIERRYDEGRSLLTPHQLCVFTALLEDMRSPFRSKWLGYCLDHLGSCRSHLAGLPPATLVLAVELALRGRGWDEQRLLSKLLRQLFCTYAKHPAAAARNLASNVSGCPPRAASRIITGFGPSAAASSFSSGSAASSPAPPPSLAALAAAAAWDFEVGGTGGAASPRLDLASLVDWLASKVPWGPGPERKDTLEFLEPLVAELVEGGRGQLAELAPARIPALIKAVALLGYSPSRDWVSEAFARMAGGAETLSGSELVAMLRVSHAKQLPLPHATLDAVCGQHRRILPLMRAVDLQRLLECWVADRYIPSREQLEGFFDAVCDVFGLDPEALKAAAAVGAPSATASGSFSPMVSFDADSVAASEAAGGPRREAGGRAAGGGRRSSGAAAYMDLGLLQSAGGVVSAGSADGVAGGVAPWRRTSSSSSAVVEAAAGSAPGAARGTGPGGPQAAPGGAVQTPAASSPASKAAADATAAAAAATAADAAARAAIGPVKGSLGSLDERPKGSLLQPSEAQAMLQLLDQYRALLLEAKRSDLLVVMNTYRNAVTVALHDIRRVAGSSGKPPSGSRLLQAVLRSAPP